MKSSKVVKLSTALAGIALLLGPLAVSARGPSIESLMGSRALEDNGITLEIPDSWSLARRANVHVIINTPGGAHAVATPESLRRDARIIVHTETFSDHAAAVRWLRVIGVEKATVPTIIEIGGWPALQRRLFGPRPQGKGMNTDEYAWKITTAVAVENLVIRMDAWAPEDSSDALLSAIEAIGASLRTTAVADPAELQRELEGLRQPPGRALPAPQQPASSPDEQGVNAGAVEPSSGAAAAAALVLPAPGTTVRVTTQNARDSELEIAVADGGQDIVIGANSGFFFSNDGGLTWANSMNVGSSDPAVTWGPSGGPQGTFYAANIATPTTGFWTSTDGGANFVGPTPAYTCGQNGDKQCAGMTGTPPQPFPDQEHIVADRFNQTAGGDQVYNVWRHLDGDWGIVCSQDSGATWSANAQFFNGDLPRVSVGQDSTVYVSYHADNEDTILVRRFTSCENGLTDLGASLVALDPTGVACPTPGLDRCNRRNSLASAMVAVNDTDPNHVYIAYAANTAPGNDGTWFPNCANQNLCNEDIVVQDSLDGGQTWPGGDICFLGICLGAGGACAADSDCADPDRIVTVSSGVTARRFMPWACSLGGELHVAWYDRSAATPGGTTLSNNSLTDFFRGSAFLNAVGDLAKGTEFQINEIGSTDAQCEAGAPTGSAASWPSAVDRSGDSESCSMQPQLGGQCCVVAEVNGGVAGGFCTPGNPSSSSFTRCDFNQTTCPAGEVCAIRRGSPKYGDYNGVACAEGRFYTTWASATSPPTLPMPSTNIDTFFASDLVCCVPEIQVPAPINFGTSCVADGSPTATLDVCNTGKEDLVVGLITESNASFEVTDPVGGLPVTISPDFCFPFEVTFDNSMGAQSGTLTINSNDPVNPAFDVPVTGDVGEADISTFIADSGDFGNVCLGDFKDLDLTIQNNGTCDLEIDSVSLSGADAGEFELPDGSLAGTTIEPGNSLLVPVRFVPDNFTDPAPRTASVDVASSTLGGDPLPLDQTPVTGFAPPPDINLAIANSGNFGAVCNGDQADLDLTLFNQGMCDLTISNIELVPNAGSFELPANLQLPLVLSPDADFTVPIRFSPDMCFNTPEMRTVKITSDDPDEMMVNVDVSGVAPCPNLVIDPAALSGIFAFPATVVDTTGTLGCFSEQGLNLRNNGQCPLTISGISAAGADFVVTQPTVFPILLPGGEETLGVTVRFLPQADADPLAPSEVTGQLTVVSDDPDGDGLADLCGESVAQSGVRILVTDQSGEPPVAIDNVDDMRIQSKGIHTPGPINLHFVDQPLNSALVCGNEIDYHVDQETLPATDTTGNNPNSSYKAKAKEGNLQTEQSFTLEQCEFREFQLQLEDADSPVCLLLPKGASCTNDGECCSGKCKGPNGNKSCR